MTLESDTEASERGHGTATALASAESPESRETTGGGGLGGLCGNGEACRACRARSGGQRRTWGLGGGGEPHTDQPSVPWRLQTAQDHLTAATPRTENKGSEWGGGGNQGAAQEQTVLQTKGPLLVVSVQLNGEHTKPYSF